MPSASFLRIQTIVAELTLIRRELDRLAYEWRHLAPASGLALAPPHVPPHVQQHVHAHVQMPAPRQAPEPRRDAPPASKWDAHDPAYH
jgi:hypothetical protein